MVSFKAGFTVPVSVSVPTLIYDFMYFCCTRVLCITVIKEYQISKNKIKVSVKNRMNTMKH